MSILLTRIHEYVDVLPRTLGEVVFNVYVVDLRFGGIPFFRSRKELRLEVNKNLKWMSELNILFIRIGSFHWHIPFSRQIRTFPDKIERPSMQTYASVINVNIFKIRTSFLQAKDSSKCFAQGKFRVTLFEIHSFSRTNDCNNRMKFLFYEKKLWTEFCFKAHFTHFLICSINAKVVRNTFGCSIQGLGSICAKKCHHSNFCFRAL